MTQQQVSAVLEVVVAMGNVIKELGEVPSGHLYARVMGKMSLTQYETIIATLVKGKMITNKGHLLTWVGPK